MMDSPPGKFVVLDGPDGSGKSTVAKLVRERIEATGIQVEVCRDPGGTMIGDRIRSVLLDHDLTNMDVRCEVLLFMASRAQLVREVVRPALEKGKFVLCDRFVSASCAYQVACGAELNEVLDLARIAIGDTWPGLTLVLDIPTEVGFERIGKQRGSTSLDGMERRPKEFHERVRENFLALPDRYPAPVHVIDADRSLEEVVEEVLEHIGRYTEFKST